MPHLHASTDKDLPPPPSGPSSASPENTQFPELPAAPPSHMFGHGYSSHHPVPTVQGYKSTKAKNDEQAEDYAAIVAKRQHESKQRDQRQIQQQQQAVTSAPDSAELSDGETVNNGVVEREGNAAKTAHGKTDKATGQNPANEKQKMMDQMNSNKSQSYGAALIQD